MAEEPATVYVLLSAFLSRCDSIYVTFYAGPCGTGYDETKDWASFLFLL